jgi:hypothetical protein
MNNLYQKIYVMPGRSDIAQAAASITGTPGIEDESQRGNCHILVEFIEYVSDADVTRTVIRKFAGNISVALLNPTDKIRIVGSATDLFSQIINGKADLVIDNICRVNHLIDGFPPGVSPESNVNETSKMKMILSIIKRGA